MRSGGFYPAQFRSSVVIVSQLTGCRPDYALGGAVLALYALFSGEKLRSIEKAVRAVEYGEEHRTVRSMRDMDIAARPPHEVTRTTAALRIFQRTFEHEGLLERRVLMQRHDRAGRHLEQD